MTRSEPPVTAIAAVEGQTAAIRQEAVSLAMAWVWRLDEWLSVDGPAGLWRDVAVGGASCRVLSSFGLQPPADARWGRSTWRSGVLAFRWLLAGLGVLFSMCDAFCVCLAVNLID